MTVLKTYTLEQAIHLAKPAWIVEGLIAASITLISGQPKSGKSSLVQNLIVAVLAGSTFLGRPVLLPPRRVIVVTTDADAIPEYRDRILELGLDRSFAARRLVLATSLRLDAETCEAVRGACAPGDGDLIIWDHLSDMAGDLNSQADVARTFADIRRASGGAGIVVLAHSSTATGPTGHASRKPLGSTVIAAKARWIVHIEKRGNDERILTTQGNGASGEMIRLQVGSTAADLQPLQVFSSGELERKRRDRSKATLDRRGEQFTWYESNCLRMTKAEAARMLAAQFGDKEVTWANRLAPSGWLGQMISKRGGSPH